jgi:hypothetical protein
MGLQRFSLSKLSDLDGGRAIETFQNALKVAVKDCLDRPGDKRPRKVVLQMTLKPVARIDGATIDCDGADANFQCKTMLPHYETPNVNFGVQQSGDLIFNPDSPRDHKQTTLLNDPDE